MRALAHHVSRQQRAAPPAPVVDGVRLEPIFACNHGETITHLCAHVYVLVPQCDDDDDEVLVMRLCSAENTRIVGKYCVCA